MLNDNCPTLYLVQNGGNQPTSGHDCISVVPENVCLTFKEVHYPTLNPYPLFQGLIVGYESQTINAISSDIKQALMDAFHCDVRLTISVHVQKSRPGRGRQYTTY